MKRGLIVEDVPETRAWLADILVFCFPAIEVNTADSVAGALSYLSDCTPDIALVDLGLPDGSGIALIRELSANHPQAVCIVTTIFGDDQHVFPALRAGARGYVLKGQTREELTGLLHGIVSGQPPLSPAIARRLMQFFGPTQALKDGVKLSPREAEVLTMIAKGLTIAKVAELLGIRYSTAAGYVKEIYRKLNVSSRAEAAMEATRLGIVNTTSE